MKLYFVRHGKASQVAATDAQRPLTEDGIQSMENMGEALNRMGIRPQKIFSSPRLRARQTAEIFGKALSQKVEITETCNFHFSVSGAFQLLQDLDNEAEVIFVGHNPSMSEVVEAITGAAVELSTGSVACVTRIYPPGTNGAVLKWLLTPKVIDPILDNEGV